MRAVRSAASINIIKTETYDDIDEGNMLLNIDTIPLRLISSIKVHGPKPPELFQTKDIGTADVKIPATF